MREHQDGENAGPEASKAPLAPGVAQAAVGPEAFAALDAGLTSSPSVRALQRAVGNRSFGRLAGARRLARQGKAAAQPAHKSGGERLAFIMGAAVKGKKKDGEVDIDAFYLAATRYFEQELGAARVRKDVRSLDAVIREVNRIGKPISELFVVSHGSATGTLSFKLFDTSTESVTQFRDVRSGLDTKTLATGDTAVFTAATTVHIKGCNVGRGSAMGNALDEAFGGAAKVITSTHWQGYRLKPGSSNTYEEGFTGYYIELPGDVNLGDDELKEKIAKKYPWVSKEQWAGWFKQLKASRKVVRKRVFWVDQWDDQATQERSGKKYWGTDEFKREVETKKSGRPDLLVYGSEALKPGASRQYAEELSTQWALRSTFIERDGKLFAPTGKEKPDYLTTSTFGDPAPGAAAPQAQPAAATPAAAGSAAPAAAPASRIAVDVHVVTTEDWTGADEVYVKLTGPGGVEKSDIHSLNDGQKFTFSLSAKPFGDFSKPVKIEVYDEDSPDADDLIVRMTWSPPYGAIKNTASYDEADYKVVARLG